MREIQDNPKLIRDHLAASKRVMAKITKSRTAARAWLKKLGLMGGKK